jgi:hypothetical protein
MICGRQLFFSHERCFCSLNARFHVWFFLGPAASIDFGSSRLNNLQRNKIRRRKRGLSYFRRGFLSRYGEAGWKIATVRCIDVTDSREAS